MYEKVEKAADDIQGSVKKMLAIGKMTYTDDEAGKKAQENDKENLFKNIKEFVSDFNTVRDELTDIGGVANLALRKTLDSIVSTYTSDLKDIGITVLKSGEISLDEKTLEKADFDKGIVYQGWRFCGEDKREDGNHRKSSSRQCEYLKQAVWCHIHLQ